MTTIPNYIQLADEQFNEPREIDIVLEADIFWELLLETQLKLSKRSLIIQNTKVSWTIS